MNQNKDQLSLDDIIAFLREVDVFSKCDDAALHDIASALEVVNIPKGAVLLKQLDIADSFYIVVTGKLTAVTQHKENEELAIGDIGPREFVGEIGLLIDERHTVTVRASEDSTLLKLEYVEYRRLLQKHSKTIMDITKVSIKRIVTFLGGIEIFAKYQVSVLHDIGTAAKVIYITSGDMLLHQNEVSDSFYIVMHGRLRAITYDEKGGETVIGEIGQGEFVGEIGLLIEGPRTASIQAIRDSVLLKFSKEDFDKLLQIYPQTIMDIAKFSIKRLVKRTLPKNSIITIALLPAGNNPRFADFVSKFVAELENFGSTLYLSSISFKNLYSTFNEDAIDSFENEKIISWLNQQETLYRYIVYQADTKPTDWTSRCIRQADRILLVGLHGSNYALNEIEEEFFKEKYTKYKWLTEFVLSHDVISRRPFHTAKWLNLRPVTNYHQLLMQSKSDFAKLARFLTGRAHGLVLSGGGARGLAHIGVIRAIRELNIEIDIVGGTSMGAWIGGLFALGRDYRAMLDAVAMAVRVYGKTFRYTFPLVSIFNDYVLTTVIKESYDDNIDSIYIEDLWQRFFCVSTNLTQSGISVHDRGLLWRAIRASTSLPVIFPPVINEKNELLIDGGITNNLPVDVMHRYLNDGISIAVIMMTSQGKIAYEEYELSSGWRLLLRQLNPFQKKKKFPTMGQIVMNATLLSSRVHSTMMSKEATHCLIVDCSRYGPLDFKSFHEIIEIGYRTALEEFSKDIYKDIKSKVK